MKILVTGASGFVGRHLYQKLKASGKNVVGISLKNENLDQNKILGLDLKDRKKLHSFFKKHHFSAIIHLAANVPSSFEDKYAKECFWDNVLTTYNLLEEFQASTAKRFIFVSSISLMKPISKNYLDENADLSINNFYSLSKLFGELMSERFAASSGKVIISFRLSSPYGPGQKKESVISTFIKNASVSKPITVFGTGKRLQDFIHVDDVVSALILALENGLSGVYLLGSGESTSTKKLAEVILANMPDSKSKIIFKGKDPQENIKIRLNISKLKRDLKFTPKITFEEGIKDYVANLKNNENRNHK